MAGEGAPLVLKPGATVLVDRNPWDTSLCPNRICWSPSLVEGGLAAWPEAAPAPSIVEWSARAPSMPRPRPATAPRSRGCARRRVCPHLSPRAAWGTRSNFRRNGWSEVSCAQLLRQPECALAAAPRAPPAPLLPAPGRSRQVCSASGAGVPRAPRAARGGAALGARGGAKVCPTLHVPRAEGSHGARFRSGPWRLTWPFHHPQACQGCARCGEVQEAFAIPLEMQFCCVCGAPRPEGVIARRGHATRLHGGENGA